MFSALSKVCEKANSVKTATVDAPTWIHKYIIGKNGSNIKKITQDFSKVNNICWATFLYFIKSLNIFSYFFRNAYVFLLSKIKFSGAC